jgi:hypothetical protein
MTRPLLAFLSLLTMALVVTGCGDEEICSRQCPPGQVCVISGGEELCLEANCGGVACLPGTICVNDQCVDDIECTGCTADQHCVYGVCVDDYTADNVCDPLRQCRLGCGTNIRCLNACESDASASCSTCLQTLGSCERRESCEAGAANNCCESEFCTCFPATPGCGLTAACLSCQLECDGDFACFNECSPTDLACSRCLRPFDECREAGGTCEEELCDCLDASLEPDCR